MKPASAQFLSQLEVDATTLCRIWRITPLRGGTLHFTDHDQDIVYGGDTYVSSESFSASSIETIINVGSGNLEITALRDELMSREEVERGIYDGAECEIDLIFYDHTDYGTMPVFEGVVSGTSLPNLNVVIFDLLGSSGRMQGRFMEQYSPTCRATFCDARCTLDIETFGEAFTVDSIDGTLEFTSSQVAAFDTKHFDLGSILWATGDNAGIVSEVASSYDDGRVVLLIRTQHPITAGDTGTIYRGCDKTLASCTSYNNVLNFRGEPYVPGNDFVEAPSNSDTSNVPSGPTTPPGPGWSPTNTG